MKIALVILHADPARGGAERYTIDLASALAQRRHDVHLLAQTFADVPKGVTSAAMPTSITRTLSYRQFVSGVSAHIAKTKFDIVHAMLPVLQCDVYHPHAGLAAEAAEKANRYFNPRRMAMARVERKILCRDDTPMVISLSEYVKASFSRHYPLRADRIATLFNAVDLAKFNPSSTGDARSRIRQQFNIDPDKIVALMIAQDFERKGLREAIAATAKVADSRLVLLVVGKEKTRNYEESIERTPAADHVIFAGPTTDPRSFYAAADFFVLPTRHDPCSLVVLEALAMGLPVISTIFNGACEIMTEGTHGHVLKDPADVDSLAAAMKGMLVKEVRERMSQACFELRPRLAYERHLDGLMKIYESALKHH